MEQVVQILHDLIRHNFSRNNNVPTRDPLSIPQTEDLPSTTISDDLELIFSVYVEAHARAA